ARGGLGRGAWAMRLRSACSKRAGSSQQRIARPWFETVRSRAWSPARARNRSGARGKISQRDTTRRRADVVALDAEDVGHVADDLAHAGEALLGEGERPFDVAMTMGGAERELT